MSEPKFTKNMKLFCDKQANGRFNIGIEDSEHTVLCYTASGNPETRLANVTLWSKSDEMYAMLEELATCGAIANGLYVAKIKKLLAKARGKE